MANNKARRLLAVGSAAALGLSGLVAAPAKAVDAITLALTSGTSYNSVTGYTNEITLNTSIAAAYSDADQYLSYRITNAGEADVQVNMGYVKITEGQVDGTDADAFEYADTTVLADSDSANKTFDETDVVVAPKANVLGDYSKNNLVAIGVKDATAKNYTVTITAWLDNNNNNVMDSTEVVSNAITLTFYDETNVAATATVQSPALGAGKVVVHTTTTPELNGQQLGANFIDALVTAQGNSGAVFASNTFDSDGTKGSTTYDGTNKRWVSTAYLAYSKTSDSWTGTDTATADEDLSAVPVAGSKWYVHNNADSTGTTFTVYSSSDSTAANATNASLTNAGTDAVVIAGMTATTAGAETAVGVNGLYLVAGAATVAASKIDFTRTATTAMEIGDVYATGGLELVDGDLYFVKAATATLAAAGTYTADVYINGASGTKMSAASGAGVAAATADDTIAVVAGSDNYSFTYANSNSGHTTKVREDYVGAVPVTVTVYDENGDEVGAGINALVKSGTPTGTIYVGTTKLALNKEVAFVTDAKGQFTFNVSSTTAAAGNTVALTVSPEGLTGAKSSVITFTWEAAKHALYDLKDAASGSAQRMKRTVEKTGSVTFDLALVDQWGTELVNTATAKYRYSVALSGNSSGTTTTDLDSDGVTSVTVTDSQLVGGSGSITVDVTVQKLLTSGWSETDGLTSIDSDNDKEWTTGDSSRRTITVITAQTDAVALDTATTTVGNVALDDTGTRESQALVAQDNKLGTTDQTLTATVTIGGVVRNSQTLAVRNAATVTVSGNNTLFFKVGDAVGKGSLTFLSEDDGDLDIKVFSNVVQENSVVTVTSGGSSKTVKVTFAGGIDELDGVAINIDAPDYVSQASTLQFTVTVVDKYGNGVDTDQAGTANNFDAGDAAYKITYTGPGLIVGTQPKDVKEASNLGDTFNVLLGANDTGTITIKVQYDKSGDNDFLDDTDITVTKVITIGEAPAAAADTKVNAGSFKGYVAIYAKGYEGKRLSAKVGKDWVVVPALASDFVRVVEYTGAGYTINVPIYIDRVLVDTITVTTK